MLDVLRSLTEAALQPEPFPPTSRYHDLPVATLVTSDGRPIAYVRRRFLPALSRFTAVGAHTVVEGDRLDALAARYLGDPEQFWRLCDANGVMHPQELVEAPGTTVSIALPEGYGGVRGA